MAQRTQLQLLLKTLADNVYFQPAANVQMTYPCIVYKRDDMDTKFSDNTPYHVTRRYLVTVIDTNPDSTIVDAVALLPQCLYNRGYAADNLNHDVFTLYF